MSLETYNIRLKYLGTDCDDRRVKGKLKTFNKALWNSYQAEWVTFDKEESQTKHRCLINPDKLKEDYDKKAISINFHDGLKEGDTFYWTRTNTHWLVMLQHIEEEAYYRAAIERCDYCIEVKGKQYWIYVRGPVETTTQWRQKHQLEMNDLNYSLVFYVTKNEDTLDFFTRHQIVKFEGHRWKVAATDKYGQDNIIQVYLDEYYDNEIEEHMAEPEIQQFEDDAISIDGPQQVNVYDEKILYVVKNINSGEFVVNSNKVKLEKIDDTSCYINILTGKKDSFKISYLVDGEEKTSLDVLIKSF